jgi:hypothetical protein
LRRPHQPLPPSTSPDPDPHLPLAPMRIPPPVFLVSRRIKPAHPPPSPS